VYLILTEKLILEQAQTSEDIFFFTPRYKEFVIFFNIIVSKFILENNDFLVQGLLVHK
jgi:hypothetical protein